MGVAEPPGRVPHEGGASGGDRLFGEWDDTSPLIGKYERRPSSCQGDDLEDPHFHVVNTQDDWQGECGCVTCGPCARCMQGNRRICTLTVVFILNFIFTIAQMFAAYFSNSLALAMDSVHMFVDNISYAVNIYAEIAKGRARARRRAADPTLAKDRDIVRQEAERAFCIEMGAASFSAISLVVITVIVVGEAINRIRNPHVEAEVSGWTMLSVTCVGFVFDIISVMMFCFGADHGHSHGMEDESNSDADENHGHAHGFAGCCGMIATAATAAPVQANEEPHDEHSHDDHDHCGHAHAHGPASGHNSDDEHGHAHHQARALPEFCYDLNMCAAFTHVFADLMRSCVVLIAAYLIINGMVAPGLADAWCSLIVSLVVIILSFGIANDIRKALKHRRKQRARDRAEP